MNATARGVGHEGGEDEEDVGREVAVDHRPYEADALRQPRRNQLRERRQQARREENSPRGRDRHAEALVEPESQQRLHDKSTAERIDAEQCRQTQHQFAGRSQRRGSPA
jgi:hypothetical protein